MKRGTTLSAAKKLYEQSLELRIELGDRQGQISSLKNLRDLALREADEAEHNRLCERVRLAEIDFGSRDIEQQDFIDFD